MRKTILFALCLSALIAACSCGLPSVTTTDTIDTTDTTAETTVETTAPEKAAMVLDGAEDALYVEQGLGFEATGLYIYSSTPELRKVDENGNSPFWETEGRISVAFDGEAMWYYMEVYDPTFFEPDTEYIMNTENPWKTNSIELWYCYDGKKLLHVDVDAYGTRLFTDKESTSVYFDEITYAVKTDAENKKYFAEIRIPAKNEAGVALKSGDPLWYAFQINDLRVSPEIDPSRNNNLATSGGHNIDNFTKIILP